MLRFSNSKNNSTSSYEKHDGQKNVRYELDVPHEVMLERATIVWKATYVNAANSPTIAASVTYRAQKEYDNKVAEAAAKSINNPGITANQTGRKEASGEYITEEEALANVERVHKSSQPINMENAGPVEKPTEETRTREYRKEELEAEA